MPEIITGLMDWRNLIDVLLMAIGLFALYRTMRRRGTWKIMAGILLAMAIFLLANLLDLKGIKWIYSNLSNVILIAFIVIFQPELRKIFEQAVSLGRRDAHDPAKTLSQMIAEGLWHMSQQRRGSIIVFPGREPVDEYVSGGYDLDAKASYPLLLSIFDPHSPGHDGALIVSKGLFTRFGTRLPVSESAALPEEYGTRHHAAMGLSEKTDALVLVVSEERGKISIFHMGQMTPADNMGQVVNIIEAHWKNILSYPFAVYQRETRRSFFYQAAISFSLAVFFWSSIIVAQSERVEKVISVPVEYSLAASDLVLVGEREKELQLYLAGAKSTLDTVKPSDLAVKIDLSVYGPGTQSVFITSDNIRLPKGVSLLETRPSQLELTLAAITEKWAEITPQLVGSLPPGVTLGSVTVIPERVKILSPEPGDTKTVISVTTTPVYLESIYKNSRVLCKIIAPQTVQPLRGQWPDVEVAIEVNVKEK